MTSTDWRSRVFFEYEYVRGIRTRNLKYVERTAEWPSELYDLEADPGEKKNLIADPAYQQVLSGLRVSWLASFAVPARRQSGNGARPSGSI